MGEDSSPPLTTLSREITRKLTRRIVDQVYPPGTKLPTERDLAVEFDVTRHVVREALKRIEALGLVTIRQGSGILVQDIQLTGGIELIRSLLEREDGSLDLNFLRDVLEFRALIGQAIFRLAAENRTEEDIARIRAIVDERRGKFGDAKRLQEINGELFRAFARATHNQIYQMIVNTFGKIIREMRVGLVPSEESTAQMQRLLEQILDAIERRDGEVAEVLAVRHAALLRQQLAEHRSSV